MMSEEDATGDEDDFFGNPLKHLMCKLESAKNNGITNYIKKKELTKKDTSTEKTNILDTVVVGLTDDDDDVTSRGKKKIEDSALLKVEQEIKELENFSNISALTSLGLGSVTSSSRKNGCKRNRKIMNDTNSNSLVNPIITDGGTLEADDITFTEEEVFVIEPHCTIEIVDLESCDTYIKRWKMNETFTNISKLYAANWSCSPENVILSLMSGKRISAEDTPRSVAFSEKDVNYLSVYKNSESGNSKTGEITVKWLLPERSNPITTTIPRDTPFMILKRDFAIGNDLDEKKLTLVFDSERISPEETVNTLGMEDGDCIDVYIK